MILIHRKEEFLIDREIGCSVSTVESAYLEEHDHDYYEFFVLLEGEVYHQINDAQALLSKRAFCFLKPGDIHCFRPFKNGQFKAINFMITKQFMEDIICLFNNNQITIQLIKGDSETPFLLNNDYFLSINNRFEGILSLPPNRKRESLILTKLIVIDILSTVAVEMHKKDEKQIPEWFELLLKEMQIDNNYMLGVKYMELLTGKSREYISRLFKKYMLMTPTKFINETKLQHARMMLTNTDKSILDVSLEVGFNSQSNFYKAFEERFNISPGNFRKLLKR